jgi:hypothetical protein
LGGFQLDVWQYDNSHTPGNHPMKGKARLLACGPCFTQSLRAGCLREVVYGSVGKWASHVEPAAKAEGVDVEAGVNIEPAAGGFDVETCAFFPHFKVRGGGGAEPKELNANKRLRVRKFVLGSEWSSRSEYVCLGGLDL